MDFLNEIANLSSNDWNMTITYRNSQEFQEIFRNLNETLSENYVWWSYATKSLIIILYCLLITVSLIGNCLVIRVLLCVKFRSTTSSTTTTSGNDNRSITVAHSLIGTSRSHRLHIHTGTGTSKLLIVNLAISDLLLTTFNIPVNLIRYLTDDWPFGANVCRLVPFVQSVSAYCSAWTMLFIAFERFRKIIQQQKFHRRLASQQQQHHPHHHHHHHHHDQNQFQHTHISHVHQNHLQESDTNNNKILNIKSNPNQSTTYNDEYALSALSNSTDAQISQNSSNKSVQESSFDSALQKNSLELTSITVNSPMTVSSDDAYQQQLINSCDSINHQNRNDNAFIILSKKFLKLLSDCLCYCPSKIFYSCFQKQRLVHKVQGENHCSCKGFVLFYEANTDVGVFREISCPSTSECRVGGRQCCYNSRCCPKSSNYVANQPGSAPLIQSINDKKKKITSQRTELDSCLYRRLPAWLILIVVWGIALILSYPHTLHTGVFRWKHPHPTIDYMFRCRTNLYPNDQTKFAQSLYTFISQYAIPIGLTTLFYLHIGIFLWKRQTVGALSEGRRALMLKRKRRRVRMLIFVVLVFAACWAPLNIYRLATDHKWLEEQQGLFFLLHMIAMSSVCYNPFIYCWLNEAFRRKARFVLRRLLPCSGNVRHFLQRTHHHLRRLRRLDHPLTPVFSQPNANLPNTETVTDGRGDDSLLGRPSVRLDIPTDERSSTWSSSMSATGKQQAISELISMSALLEQDLLDSSKRFSTGSSALSGQTYENKNVTFSDTENSSTTIFRTVKSERENRTGSISTHSDTGTTVGEQIATHSTESAAYSEFILPTSVETAVAKHERLAMITTQSGKRRIHATHHIGD